MTGEPREAAIREALNWVWVGREGTSSYVVGEPARTEALAALDALVARVAALTDALRDVLGACVPPVEALAAVHADGKFISPELVEALGVARDELRRAVSVLATAGEPEAAMPPNWPQGLVDWPLKGYPFPEPGSIDEVYADIEYLYEQSAGPMNPVVVALRQWAAETFPEPEAATEKTP